MVCSLAHTSRGYDRVKLLAVNQISADSNSNPGIEKLLSVVTHIFELIHLRRMWKTPGNINKDSSFASA